MVRNGKTEYLLLLQFTMEQKFNLREEYNNAKLYLISHIWWDICYWKRRYLKFITLYKAKSLLNSLFIILQNVTHQFQLLNVIYG